MFRPFLLAAVAAALASLALPATAQLTPMPSGPEPVAARSVQVLTPEASRALRLNRMPTTQSTPFLIGTRWQCEPHASGFDRCDLVLVVCTNDQSLCVEV
jgi:hypothetical protein